MRKETKFVTTIVPSIYATSPEHSAQVVHNMAQGESSKQAKKRAKKQKRSIEATLMNDFNAGLRINEQEGSNVSANQAREKTKKQKRGKNKSCDEEDSNVIADEIPNDSRDTLPNTSNESQRTTRSRGPTRCSALPVESGNRLEVELNEHGQPIGTNSKYLSTFVGSLTREMVSIVFDDWRHVPNESKEYYWQAVVQKFTFKDREEEAKTYVLQQMGRLARANKSKLGKFLKKKPNDIDPTDWEVFVKKRSSKKFKEKSTTFKQMRGKQTMRYLGSRKGFARIADEILKKEGSCPKDKVRLRAWVRGYTNEEGEAKNPKDNELIKKAKEILLAPSSEGSTKSGCDDDALSHLITQPEQRGRLRGAGAGATKCKLVAQAKYSEKVVRLENKIESMQGKIDSMSDLVEKQAKLINTLMKSQNCDQQEQDDDDDEVNTDEDMNSQSKVDSMQGQIKSISKLLEKQNSLIDTLMKNQGHHQQKQKKDEENNDEDSSDEGNNDEENTGDEDSNDDENTDEENLRSPGNIKSKEQNIASTTPSTTPQSHNGSSSRLSKDKKCKLLNWKKPKEIVAIGRWVTDDPKTVVHGTALGKDVSRVWVDLVLQPTAPLYRPCFGHDTVEEIQGSVTAWPTKHILMLDD
ncbi:uncharacterized protein M6B38_318720 [Iris pallida]|uniref:Transposase Tnp1/En/Spm-like domain-containing protein n=1 Tax=Iris pallida TaxID=29817 RepID=A0AAX6HCV5_IRIPA|nr:uncharacterized protein M6B38_318720 [Iris pallida]